MQRLQAKQRDSWSRSSRLHNKQAGDFLLSPCNSCFATLFLTGHFLYLFASFPAVLSKSSAHEVAYSEVQAIEGREGRIGCNGTTSTSIGWEEDAVQIFWFRGESSIPIFTVDARNSTSLSSGLTIPSADLEGRVVFDPGPVPTLRIRKILRYDEGDYRCRSLFRRSRTQKCLIILTVISE